jgi:disulfide bond formation protein DsbB
VRQPGGGAFALSALLSFGAVFVAIGAWALIGALVPARLARVVSAIGVSLLAGCGIAAALWQHFVAAASASCNLTFADRVMNATGLNARFPEVFAAYASCADAAVSLAGIPYEFYSLALFVLIDGLAILALVRRR